jgi:excisionase family DNA binding protein
MTDTPETEGAAQMPTEASSAIISGMTPPPPPDPGSEYLTRQEAADLLRVRVLTIDRLARSGKLTRYRVATGETRGRTLFRADEVRGLIQREEQA